MAFNFQNMTDTINTLAHLDDFHANDDDLLNYDDEAVPLLDRYTDAEYEVACQELEEAAARVQKVGEAGVQGEQTRNFVAGLAGKSLKQLERDILTLETGLKMFEGMNDKNNNPFEEFVKSIEEGGEDWDDDKNNNPFEEFVKSIEEGGEDWDDGFYVSPMLYPPQREL
eukprot:CAMPEP_0113266138 /NCGR_PEP_ID=MMETSP0008_2-20120614/19896_1 /TAXON_ID=97485 /ORGANISM="Prymnesium parvum" /LENGTH=168 /DNA_ID=CAMNT_0000115045 /DNA_START=42 /DNA_END=549 /DNA_ORIENTATION=- /assembly_acc=CAM_ASM_000153